jgi:hypothetical protein
MRDRHLSLTFASVIGLVSFLATVTIAQAPSAPATTAKPAAPATAKPAAPTAKPATPATAKPAAGAKPAVVAANIRTPWGAPDLQGTWFVIEDVPMERSAENVKLNKEFLTDEEVAAADKRKAEGQGRNTRAGAATTQDVEGAYNAAFNSILRTGKRTSRVIDPPDGRIPPTVGGGQGGGRGAGFAGRGAGGAPPAGAAGAPAAGAAGVPPAGAGGRAQAGGAAGAGGGRVGGGGGGRGAPGGGNDNPENIAQSPRCLGVGLPFLPINTTFAQGTVMRIVQSPKSMSIYMEDDHAGGGNRVIYMDGRPHPPASMKLYLGDSRGRWEGDTLVVETTNFSQGMRVGFGGGGSNPDTTKLIERYTRTGTNDLRREITFDDSSTWTRPFTVLVEMGKVGDQKHMIFESACHEGNYGMTGILVGSRMEERAAAAKPSK